MKRLGVELTVAALAASNVVGSVLLQVLVLAIIGPGRTTDAFFAAATLPTIVAGVLGVVLPAVLVPRWSAASREQQAAECRALLLAIVALVGAIALGLAWGADRVFPVLFNGFTGNDLELGVQLFRIQLLGMVAGAAVAVITALYAARMKFVVVEVTTLAVALVAIIVLAVGLPSLGIAHAAWVSSARPAALLLVLLPALGSGSLPAAAGRSIAAVLHAVAPMAAANAYYKSEILVDRHLLSSAAPGELSLYGIAYQLYSAGSAVLGKVWGSNAVPLLAQRASESDRAGFMHGYRRNLLLLAGASLCIVLVIAAIGEPLLQLAVQPTRASGQDAHRIWLYLLLLSGVLVGGSAGALLAGAFYALGDTVTPTVMSVISFTLFIVLRVLAFRQSGIDGLCLAVSGYYLSNAMLLAMLFPRTLRRRFAA